MKRLKGLRRWFDDHKTWRSDDWNSVIRSDESSFTLFPTSGRVYVWITPKEAYNPECLVPSVKHGGGSVMIWAAISWYSAGPIITLSARNIASDYMDILGNQVLLMVQMLFEFSDAVFQYDKSPIHTARSVQSWFEEHEDACQHLPWPAQSPDLNIIISLWSAWESGVRSVFPPPWSLKQPDVLHEEWCNIPLETIQNLYGPAFYVLLTVHAGMTLGKWPTWCTITLYKTIYDCNPLHVSSITVLIIRR